MKIYSVVALLLLMGCAGPKMVTIHKEIPLSVNNK